MTGRAYLRLLLLITVLLMLVSAPALQTRSSAYATSYSEMSNPKMPWATRTGQRSTCPPGTRACPGGDCVPIFIGCDVSSGN